MKLLITQFSPTTPPAIRCRGNVFQSYLATIGDTQTHPQTPIKRHGRFQHFFSLGYKVLNRLAIRFHAGILFCLFGPEN
jgi:hypothetical protein